MLEYLRLVRGFDSHHPLRGRQQNKRLRERNGVRAADFPKALIVDEPLRKVLK